jgi:hypothetical protein
MRIHNDTERRFLAAYREFSPDQRDDALVMLREMAA